MTPTCLGEHVQRERIDALLVDHHEVLPVRRAAQRVLEVDDRPHLVVRELPLRRHQLVALLRRAVHERRVRLALLVLQRHVQDEDVAVRQRLRHVRVTSAVVHNETLNETTVHRVLRDHLHLLDHQHVQRLPRTLHRQHGVGHHLRQVVRKLSVTREKTKTGSSSFVRSEVRATLYSTSWSFSMSSIGSCNQPHTQTLRQTNRGSSAPRS